MKTRIDNIAVDGEGHVLPYGPDEVQAIVNRAFDDPDCHVLAIVMQKKDDLMVQVLGPPSRDVLRALEQTTRAYKSVMRGHA